jgi:hypothetical protein
VNGAIAISAGPVKVEFAGRVKSAWNWNRFQVAGIGEAGEIIS